MIYKKFKCSAVHNLVITKLNDNEKLNEGICIPTSILEKVDMHNGQEVIITKIGSGPWKNRLKTFIIENKDNNEVEVRGSLTHFLAVGDLTCLITECYLKEDIYSEYGKDEYAIFDLGFDPKNNKDNTISQLDLQFYSHKEKDVKPESDLYKSQIDKRKKLFFFGGAVF